MSIGLFSNFISDRDCQDSNRGRIGKMPLDGISFKLHGKISANDAVFIVIGENLPDSPGLCKGKRLSDRRSYFCGREIF